MTTPPTRIGPVDVARRALERPAPSLTPARIRVMHTAGTLWCRMLQLPTVRQVATAAGLTAHTTVLGGFGSVADVHAQVVRQEWGLLVGGWFEAEPSSRSRWLGDHVQELRRRDPAALRLPGLVCSAVLATGLVPKPSADLLVPLLGLAALVPDDASSRPGTGPGRREGPPRSADRRLRAVPA